MKQHLDKGLIHHPRYSFTNTIPIIRKMKFSQALILAAPLVSALPTIENNAVVKRDTSLFNFVETAVGSIIDAVNNAISVAQSVTQTQVTFQVPAPSSFQSWKTYKANGVNLGGWLVLEKGIDPAFFNNSGAASAIDEDSFCKLLGPIKCALALEERYATYFTNSDIDEFASYGVNTLRVPVGYWAFMPALKGDHYYTGSQLLHLGALSQYAITKGMHIIVDLHGLPGGQNAFDNQGKVGALDWVSNGHLRRTQKFIRLILILQWNNSTNFAHTLDLVNLATNWILAQPNNNHFTLSLINEPLPEGPALFGQTNASFAYLNKYYNAALTQVRQKTTSLPVMFSDGFAGPQIWDQWWANSTQNIVFDTHIYFFSGGSYSYDAPYAACYLAKSYQVATNPVFIGEWSIQAGTFNMVAGDTRKNFFQAQFAAYQTFLQGSSFWNGKHNGTVVVGNDGSTQKEYWSWEQLASEGIVPKPGADLSAYAC